MRRAVMTIIAVLGTTVGWTAPVHASNWGCEVLLCLSNPGGATQFPQCVPSITKLWSDLAMGKAFPTCTGGGVIKAKVYNQSSPSRRYVAMTFSDGTQKTYSLADSEAVGVPGTGAPGSQLQP